MTWRASDHDDGPEPLPPEELLHYRQALVTSPRDDVRARHISNAAAESRKLRAAASAQALARRGARVIAGVAATIVVSSSLAGASIITQPARSIFPAITDQFLPRTPPAEPADVVEVETEAPSTTKKAEDEPATSEERSEQTKRQRETTTTVRDTATTTAAVIRTEATTSTTEKKASPTTQAPTTTVVDPSTTTTTVPDPSSTTTTVVDPSTTTTVVDGSTTTTEPSTTTTTTSSTAGTSTKAPPVYATRDGGGS